MLAVSYYTGTAAGAQPVVCSVLLLGQLNFLHAKMGPTVSRWPSSYHFNWRTAKPLDPPSRMDSQSGKHRRYGSWAVSACYDALYPLSDGPSTQNHRHMTDFRLCSTCQSCRHLCCYFWPFWVPSTPPWGRPSSQTTHHMSWCRITAIVRYQKNKRVFHWWLHKADASASMSPPMLNMFFLIPM